jgi:hypothetical protein
MSKHEAALRLLGVAAHAAHSNSVHQSSFGTPALAKAQAEAEMDLRKSIAVLETDVASAVQPAEINKETR